ncbi:5-hydroxytryptamine receptor 1B-like [Paramacrobiotus metropolitanus]|uniref:5-hydroxytryptamine receptor 1B-like n=1 Tax=Paramacrobiotus metropolitanus TaxID=2943436 RepID=UPI002445EB9D|nr:5-hydroxytryptamine receptor 1B-like [Paramacrobiotus metropolitanus]
MNNSTGVTPRVTLGWGPLELLNLAIALLGTLLNGGMILHLIFRKSTHTPFTVYLINLLLSNLVKTAGTSLANALLYVSPVFHYSHAACDFYMMTSYFSMAGMIHTHVLISCNRLWAVTYPHAYRTRHTTPVAVAACAGMWLYLAIMLLPQLIRDSLYFRWPMELYNRCLLNIDAQRFLITTMQLVVYVLPEMFVLVTFPLIWRKRKLTAQRVAPTVTGKTVSKAVSRADTDSDGESLAPAAGTSGGSGKRRTRSMTVFVMLMVSMFICWTPLLLPTFVACFVDFKSSAYFRVTTLLFTAEAIIDPVLFALVFVDGVWRRVSRMFRFVS